MNCHSMTARKRSQQRLKPGLLQLFVVIVFFVQLNPVIAFTPPADSLDLTIEDLVLLSINDLARVKVVTASKKPQKLVETPATVRVITAQQISDHGYLTLEDALADLPGFQFRNIQGFNSYIFQRGVPSQNNQILVLIDGIQINELNSGGFYGGGQYNLANVEQIEVVYGPASALYGTNAVSGIINIITKSPDEHPGFSADALYGSFGTMNINAGYGYYNKNKRTGYRISGRVYQTEKADLAGSEGDHNWSENLENFEKDISVDAKILVKDLTIGLTLQDKHSSRSTNYGSINTNYTDSGTDWHIRFATSHIKHTWEPFTALHLKSTVYSRIATVEDNTIAWIDSSTQAGYYRPNELFGIEETVYWTARSNLTITGGALFESEKLSKGFSVSYSSSSDEEPPTPSEPDFENNTLMSLYLMGQYSFIPSMKLSSGVRFDNSSVYDQILTPRMGLIYNQGRFTGKLLYMEAFRAPKPWDYSWGNGNTDLESEKMRSIEAECIYTIQSHTRIETAIYYNVIRDLLVQDPALNRWMNHGELETTGIELSLTHQVSKNISTYLNYTWNNSFLLDIGTVPEIAKNTLNLGSSWTFIPGGTASFWGNYSGERKNPHVITTTGDSVIDDYFILNGSLGYELSNGINFRITAKNILNKEYYHPSNRSNPAYFVSRYRQSQRTILVSLNWQFKPDKRKELNRSE